MRRLLLLLLAALPIAPALMLRAQQPPTGKDAKADASKSATKDKKQPETKTPPNAKSAAVNDIIPLTRQTLDKLKLPPGTIVIVTDKLKDAQEQYPSAILMTPEQYEEMRERIRVLEQQLKPDKTITHSCKLTGKLEGDYLTLRAEFTFATQQPRSLVALGLQGAHLVDEGDLDKTAPQLDYGEDGFVVRVEKEGNHQLTLNLKVPVGLKRGIGLGSATERGFDLGLPGAPATNLNLELPSGIKDVRVNDSVKASKAPGRWEVPLGLAKQVSVAWKEPLTLAGGGPLLTLDTQIVVKLEESVAQLQAELFLEDLRGQTKEWRLLLPPGATPTLKALPATAYQWVFPDGKNPWHILQLKEASAERLAVSVQASVPRPVGKLAVGPFAVANAFRQQGTVLVQTTPEGQRGQRIVYHRFGEVSQRELPKSATGLENLAHFQYALMPAPGAAVTKPPVELEFKASGGLAETLADQTVRLKGDGDSWYVETTTRIQAKALADLTDYVEVELPRLRTPDWMALRSAPTLAFPGALPWVGFAPVAAQLGWALPLEFRWEEEGTELAAQEGARRARLKWSHPSAKQLSLTIHGKYLIPPGARRVRLELPRPLGTLDRGGTLRVTSGPQVELLTGSLGAEEVVPERHSWQRTSDTAPVAVDLAWRPHQPAFPVAATVDVTLHDRSAHVRAQLHFTLAPIKAALAGGNVRLRVPGGLKHVTLEAGGKMLGEPQPDTGLLWVNPHADAAGKCELIFEYDVPLPKMDDQAAAGPVARPWEVLLLWPEGATRTQANVRVWSPPGVLPKLADGPHDWHERGTESVPGRDGLPALVVQGAGARLPLALQLHPAGQTALASLLCDRSLIQVHVDDEGNQFYRTRFLIRKLAARQLTLELPVPVRGNLQSVRFGPDRQDKALFWNDPVSNIAVIRVPSELPGFQTQQIFLDIEYKLPASFLGTRRFGQTLLFPPRWHGDVLPGAVRWQVDLPADQVALVAGGGAVLDYRWTLQGWLLAPEASVTSADLEAWLTGREGGEATPVGLAYWRPGLAPQRVIHLPRQWWLLLCSGLVLAVGLGAYLLPLGRALAWLVVATVCLGVVASALLWPALVPPLVYGCEPGVAVLAVLLGLQWLLQERYRRQVVFMPGFARLQTGSSLTRAAEAKPREPSTVDSPASAGAPAAGSSSSVK